jgi:hypothetical protein
MRVIKVNLLLIFALGSCLGGCATDDRSETTRIETTTARGMPRQKVVKDIIPAEGQRKIPVTESY